MQLNDLFSDILGVPAAQLNDDSSPANVDGWDSLMGINLIMAMQEAYGVQFDTREIEHMATLGHARRALAQRGVQA